MADADESKFILKSDKIIEPFYTDNLYKYVSAEWAHHPDDLAFVITSDEQRMTYRELGDVIDRTSRDMSSAGVRHGSVVTIWCANCAEIMIVSMAAWRLEAVVAMIGPTLTVDESRRQILKVKTSFLFVDDKHAPIISDTMFHDDPIAVAFTMGTRQFMKLPQHRVDDRPTVKFHPDRDTAMILFSSGTTGYPKAVQLTHTNMTCSLHLTGIKVTERMMPPTIHYLPMSHFYGFTLILRTFCDCSVVYLMQRFSLNDYVRLVSKYQIPVLFIVPPVAVMLTKRPDLIRQYDLSCVMAIFSSSAPLSTEVERELATLLPGLVFPRARQSYGMTETTGAVTRSSVSLEEQDPDGTVGKVLPYIEMKVLDENTGRACGPYTRGEMAVRGPLVMKGYYDDPEATKSMIDEHGWIHTGDIGYYDDKGNLFVVDRAKELIKYKGMQVAPAELENILLMHPDVDDAAVIGLPDKLAGELPLAFVVRRANSDVTEKQIQNFVAERVAVYQQLTGGVRFIDAIPKLQTGKILRRQLRDSLRNAAVPPHKL